MDRVGARLLLTNMVAADSRPVLSVESLDALLDQHALHDSQGRRPTDPGYTPDRWDLNRAAAEGWRWKAARVAGDFTFSADGASFDKGSVLAKCLEMEAAYLAKITGSAGVVGADGALGYNVDLVLP